MADRTRDAIVAAVVAELANPAMRLPCIERCTGAVVDALIDLIILFPEERWDEECHACERLIRDHAVDGRCPTAPARRYKATTLADAVGVTQPKLRGLGTQLLNAKAKLVAMGLVGEADVLDALIGELGQLENLSDKAT